MKKPAIKYLKYTVAFLFAAFAAIQAVPYGKGHVNPPIVKEPKWDAPETRAMTKRACYDCHSNETVWPVYTVIAPVSWLVYWDVMEGRKELNFSDWQNGSREGEGPAEIQEQIAGGEMPPVLYRLLHSESRLTGEEKRKLIAGLTATLRNR